MFEECHIWGGKRRCPAGAAGVDTAGEDQRFFQQLSRERLHADESIVAVLEVCGFNDWLIRMLQDYRCQKVILIQPDDSKSRKNDAAPNRH